MQTFKEYYISENKFGKAIGIGMLAAQSALGNFVDDWSKYYQTSQDPEKEARAAAVLDNKFTVPADAKKAIDAAVYIFKGDEGKTAAELKDYLEKTGAVESAYNTKVQKGGGPARSYWQVEPATAMSLVKHSSAYFGKRFHEVYGDPDLLNKMKKWDKKKWSDMLEKYDGLGATMAAAKWLSTPW